MQIETHQSEQKEKIMNKDREKKHKFIPITKYSFQNVQTNHPETRQKHTTSRDTKLAKNAVHQELFLTPLTIHPDCTDRHHHKFICKSVYVHASGTVHHTMLMSMRLLSAAPCDSSVTCTKSAHSENVRKTLRVWVTEKEGDKNKGSAHPPSCDTKTKHHRMKKKKAVLTSLTFAD